MRLRTPSAGDALARQREELAAQQAALVHALTRGAPAPAGFDADRIQAAARSLLLKRARTVARCWPRLAAELAEDFQPLFLEYARQTAPPPRGGAITEGRNFARFLDQAGRLQDGGRWEVLMVDLRFRITPDHLSRRRGLAMQVRFLPQQRRWAIAFRAPWLGVRVVWVRRPARPSLAAKNRPADRDLTRKDEAPR
jgi:hypothetical protein